MNADQKKRIAHEISNWKNACNCRAVQLTGDRMAALLQELIGAPTPEPFGYFKAEPFGWTDCAETDDGAIALFAAPPAPSVPDVAQSDADARRIVACVNALAGVSTEHLEQYGLPDFAQKISDLAQQRDNLLAALEKCRDMVGHPDNVDFINAATAEVKGQS